MIMIVTVTRGRGSIIPENLWTSYVNGPLDDEEDDDGEPVEDVVDCGGGEGAAELGAVADLRDGDDGVGHRGPDVGPHHHRDGRPEGERQADNVLDVVSRTTDHFGQLTTDQFND